jgi:equilibrative nucleoside transporter 1/2/3
MGGTSFSGLVVSALRVVSKAAFADSKAGLRNGAVAYFAVSALLVSACLALYARLENAPIFKHYRNKTFSSASDAPEPDAPDAPAGEHSNDSFRTVEAPLTFQRAISIARAIWPFAATVFSVYAVTLSIFPGFLAEDARNDALGDWYAVLLIACFNAFDVAGKMLPATGAVARLSGNPGRLRTEGVGLGRKGVFGLVCGEGFGSILEKNPLVLLTLSVLRVFFVPAFFAVSGNKASGVPYFAREPVFCVLLTSSLGLTNGWYSSVSMMLAPKRVHKDDAEVCGAMMVFFLLFGLATGAGCGWFWVR